MEAKTTPKIAQSAPTVRSTRRRSLSWRDEVGRSSELSSGDSRKGKVLFINAVNEVTRERAQSFLTDDHIERIISTYRDFTDEEGFSMVVDMLALRKQEHNLSIPLYVRGNTNGNGLAAANSDPAVTLEAAIRE